LYLLISCPLGYRFVNGTVLSQRCEPCGLGHECTSQPCVECAPCAPGSYKDTISNERCLTCGHGTFNPDAGATNIANCRRCAFCFCLLFLLKSQSRGSPSVPWQVPAIC
jgi:hypothetical protein